jgi:integrase
LRAAFSGADVRATWRVASCQWDHIDRQKKEWRIPELIMKMKRPHLVPLSRQAIEVLDEISHFTGHCWYIFPAAGA